MLGLILFMDIFAAGFYRCKEAAATRDGEHGFGELRAKIRFDAHALFMEQVPDILAVKFEIGAGGEEVVFEGLGGGVAHGMLGGAAQGAIGKGKGPVANGCIFGHGSRVDHIAVFVFDQIAGLERVAVKQDVVFGERLLGQRRNVLRFACAACQLCLLVHGLVLFDVSNQGIDGERCGSEAHNDHDNGNQAAVFGIGDGIRIGRVVVELDFGADLLCFGEI